MISFLIQYQPYIKYFLFFMWIILFTIVNRVFITDPILRRWILASFEEEPGRASGKSISAFFIVQIIIGSCVIAIMYSDNHIIPEYMYWGLITLVGGLYGIKMMRSKYMAGKNEVTNDSYVVDSGKEQECKQDGKDNGQDDSGRNGKKDRGDTDE